MDEVKKEESEMTSPAAFVEGGIQEACDDSCSICLEAFCDSDPSTVTSCKHEFHLQCVLEWCQRSSNCPMCWRPISLKDPTSQELLEAVGRERSIRRAPSRNNMAIFHHPTLVDFELQHLPVGVDDSELEERIMQHLAAAAAMGRTHRVARGSRTRSSTANTRPQLMVLSDIPNGSSMGPNNSSSPNHNEAGTETHALGTNIISGSASESQVIPHARQGSSNDNRSNALNQDSAGPSEFQPTSDNWKSRFSSLSMKYKESISRNTRGWKEKLFSRSSSMAEIGSEVKRELNAGIATVSRMMERLETRENRSPDHASSANGAANSSTTVETSANRNAETPREAPLDGNRSNPNFAPSSLTS